MKKKLFFVFFLFLKDDQTPRRIVRARYYKQHGRGRSRDDSLRSATASCGRR